MENKLENDELSPEVVAVESQLDDAVDSLPKTDDPQTPTNPEPTQLKTKEGFGAKLKRIFISKKFWAYFVFIVLVAAVTLWFIDPTRWAIVNFFGARTKVTLTTQVQGEEGQASALLKNVTLKINGASHQTDENGTITLTQPYGILNVTAEKQGYETATFEKTLDFNPFLNLLGTKQVTEYKEDVKLKSVGVPLTFKVKDWLTDEPITNGEFSVGDIVVKSDEQGVVNLKIPATDAKTIKIAAKLGGYLNKEFEVNLQSDTLQEVAFVPAGKHYFISKHTGTFGVSSSNLDGSDAAEVVAGSAKESPNLVFSASPSGKYGVLASTREGVRDARNTLLQKLYIVNLETKKLTTVDEANWFDFADWSGDTLVYVKGERDAKAPEIIQQLASIDVAANKRTDLSTADYIDVATVGLGSVVYSPGFLHGKPGQETSPQLRVVSVKGGTEKTIGNKIQEVTQLDYDRVAYQTEDNAWHEYNLNTTQVINTSVPASANRTFLASTSADGQWRLLVDKIEDKNTIILKNVASGKEEQLYGVAGLQGPVRWVGNSIVFRIVTANGASDFALSVKGGEPKKITDVTATTLGGTPEFFQFN
ncbi:MAG: hypothetical protein ACREGJ_03685 [Candidatus Saccharimonadales bacterium]